MFEDFMKHKATFIISIPTKGAWAEIFQLFSAEIGSIKYFMDPKSLFSADFHYYVTV